jgi:DNA-binding NtrC family response regulator
VRELRNAVAREIALGDLARSLAKSTGATAPPPRAREGAAADFDAILAEKLPFPAARQRVVEAFQRRYLAYMLDAHGGNVARAAEASGLALRYFQVLRARVKEPGP